MKSYKVRSKFILLPVASLFLMGVGPCPQLDKSALQDISAIATPTPSLEKHLYVASGACYGGGVTTSSGVGVISKYSLTNGDRVGTTFSYIDQSPSDQPVGLIDYSTTQLMALVENATGRRIDLVSKYGNGLNVFYGVATTLSAQLRSLSKTSDMGILVSKSSAIERISSSKLRVTSGASKPYILNPANNGVIACGTSSTLASFALELPGGKIVYGHSAATPNNKLVMISSTGYAATTDCLVARLAPTTFAMPTAAVMHPSGKLIVAYGSTTFTSNFVYSHDINESTPSISAGTAIINAPTIVNGPSAMTVDPDTGDLYIASSTANSESIEKYSYDATTGNFTRAGTAAFIPKSEYVKCVSGMSIGY